ncbi:MAG TPA: hypothetical protein VF382_03155 [Actinomycetota bacterium]
MAEIDVERTDVERFLSRFKVTVTEGGTSTHHEVTLSAADFERLGGRHRTPEEFVRACFSFLLEREPKEAILSSFEVSVISDYFPDFERRILQV